MVKVTQAEYDKFKDIMCQYFDVDGGELPKSFEKELFEGNIIQIVIEPKDHPDHPANDPALHPDDYAQALDDHFLSLQEK